MTHSGGSALLHLGNFDGGLQVFGLRFTPSKPDAEIAESSFNGTRRHRSQIENRQGARR